MDFRKLKHGDTMLNRAGPMHIWQRVCAQTLLFDRYVPVIIDPLHPLADCRHDQHHVWVESIGDDTDQTGWDANCDTLGKSEKFRIRY